jgi:hypothetical protein
MIGRTRSLSETHFGVGLSDAKKRKQDKRTAILLIACAVTLPGIAAAQTPAAPTQSNAKAAGPITMAECEGVNNCATWTFLGSQGNGQWPSGEIANLSVEHYDADSVVIRRADSTGPSAGLTAVYKGTRHEDRVGGEFTSSWPGHWDNKSGNWYATIGAGPQAPPPVIRFCTPSNGCDTFTWNDGHYDCVDDAGRRTTWTVESFSPDSVILNSVQGALTASIKGKISSQGNSIADGILSASNGFSSHFTAAWGSAIGSLPAAPREAQPVVVARPVVCYPWFFTIVCGQ